MPNLDLLKNTGVLALNTPNAMTAEKTVVVLGIARGGTTMVASVLDALGVWMGEKLGPVKEDVELSQAVEFREMENIRKIVAQRNTAHAVWGWKRPSAIEHGEVWQGSFRNPYIIAVFRDPFAIANRNRISMLSNVFQNMERSVDQLGELVQFVQKQSCPVLLCSYEKVLASPESFVRAVDEFLELNAKEKWSEAIRQINPASKEYLESSRITNSRGSLDVANSRFCKGWAFYPKQPTKVGNVQIFLNDALVVTGKARLARPDLKESGTHPSGNCGFQIEWPEGLVVKVGDIVSAQLEGDNKPLPGSPKRVIEGASGPSKIGVSAQLKGTAEVGALPSFYGIGAQKAGATWLHHMLRMHPELFLPKGKEVHYWDVHSERPLRWYRKHFEAGKINGDITPAYAILPDAKVAEIYQLTPKAKVLFSLRNPIDRAWSAVKMDVLRKYGTFPADLLAGEPQGEVLEFVRSKLFNPPFLARSNYAMTIRRWRRHFGNDALKIFRFEQIAQAPRELLREICQHLGVDSHWVESLNQESMSAKINMGEDIPFPHALREEYAARVAPFIDDLEKLLGVNFDNWRSATGVETLT